MADRTQNPPEDKDATIARLTAEAETAKIEAQTYKSKSEEQEQLIAEMASKAKASVDKATVEVDGELYEVIVPKFTHEGGFVDTATLPVEILRGLIGQALLPL